MPRCRLLTRADFDGLASAILLEALTVTDRFDFVHAADVRSGKLRPGPGDVTVNLPCVADVRLAFSREPCEGTSGAWVVDTAAPSCARLICRHFDVSPEGLGVDPALVDAVDLAVAGGLGVADVLNPQGWLLLDAITDAHSGLGRLHHFAVGNLALMRALVGYCRDHTLSEVLNLPDVAERIEALQGAQSTAREQVLRCARVFGDCVLVDLRAEAVIHPASRYLVYALFPAARFALSVYWGRQGANTVLALGRSIFAPDAGRDVAALLAPLGGGGHAAAGTCQVANADADEALARLLMALDVGGVMASA